MPSSNSVRKDQAKLIAEINKAIGWRVFEMGDGHFQVVNPDGDSVTTSGTPGLQSTLTRFRDDLKKHLNWDAEREKQRRLEKSQRALAADIAKNDAAMEEAVAKSAAFHAAEMKRLKQTLPPGSMLPDGQIVDYISEPRFFTRADAVALLRRAGNCNCNLRAISQINVQRLHEPMSAGEWMYMPHGLCLCVHGNPGDGKHRLESLSEMTDEELTELYGKPGLWFRVTYNVPPEVLDNTDMGKARTPADVLMQKGYKVHPKETASALNILLAYDRKVPWRHWSRQVYTHGTRLRALRGDYAALVQPGDSHTVLADALKLHKGAMKMTLTSALVFCFLIQRQVSYPVWEAFVNPLLTLKGFEDEDPRVSLYNNLLKKERKLIEARRGIRELGMAIKTWNKWATGQKQDLATFRRNEPMQSILSITREIPALAALNEPFNS